MSSIQLIPVLNKELKFYKTDGKFRGKAVIFNNNEFDFDDLERLDTIPDRDGLKSVLEELNFDVVVHDNFKKIDIVNAIMDISEEDHTENGSLFIGVMSHGDEMQLAAKDGYYSRHQLWEPFYGNECKALVGKPKIFFLDACRGGKTDAGVEVTAETDATPFGLSFRYPSTADILVICSTYGGHVAIESTRGGWFTQLLCEELRALTQDGAEREDFVGVLTNVNRRIAFERESMVYGKQIGTIYSTLTKKFYLV